MKISQKNRWLVVAGVILIQFCLGIIYGWSPFAVALSAPVAAGGLALTAAQTAWIFSIGIMTFAMTMVLTGRIMKSASPAFFTVLGGVLLGGGYVLAGLWGHSFIALLTLIGIVGGAGIGFAYAVVLKVAIAWYPDKVGLISGLAVAGFGFGATLWVKLAGAWFGGLLNVASIWGLDPLHSTLAIYGIALLATVLVSSIVIVNPPEDFVPEGYNPEKDDVDPSFKDLDITGKALFYTPQFWNLSLMFFLSSFGGLMVIYAIRYFGIDALSGSHAAAAATTAGSAMAVYAIMNGLGRIIYGRASDTFGRKKTLRTMMFFQAITMAAFFWVGQTPLGLIVASGIIGFNFGGNFSLFPASTAVYFGKKNVGANYGWIFLAYGLAGVAAPVFAGTVRDMAGGAGISFWLLPFMASALACVVAGLITFRMKKPEMKVVPKQKELPKMAVLR